LTQMVSLVVNGKYPLGIVSFSSETFEA